MSRESESRISRVPDHAFVQETFARNYADTFERFTPRGVLSTMLFMTESWHAFTIAYLEMLKTGIARNKTDSQHE